MKCGIVTVYNSENCGSYLQGYAMAQFLQKNGHDVVLIRQNFSDHSASRKNYLKNLAGFALKGKFAAVKSLIQRRSNFRQAIDKHLKIAKNADSVDCCLLGSDVIWDVTSSFFRKHHTFFWGTEFANAKIVSYAASVGFAKENDLKAVNFVQTSLKNMDAVSVRDSSSKELLQPYCDKQIHLVCDPTYLIDRGDYKNIAKPTELEKFIFLYCYGELPDADRKAIQAIAKQEGLKTVTFGNLNRWCDINLPYDPLLFLSIYEKADYIITNTFHGTVFSTIYEKRFAVVNNDKQKVLNVLKMCGLSDKMTKAAEDYATILHSNFDYEMTRQSIARERANSLRFLNDALEERKVNG